MVYPYILSGLIFVNCHVTQYFASERIVIGRETSWHDVLAAITAMNKTGQQQCADMRLPHHGDQLSAVYLRVVVL